MEIRTTVLLVSRSWHFSMALYRTYPSIASLCCGVLRISSGGVYISIMLPVISSPRHVITYHEANHLFDAAHHLALIIPYSALLQIVTNQLIS
jgi:hypothetical protein